MGLVPRLTLADEALATGLKGRIAEMQERLDRLQDRAAKRHQAGNEVAWWEALKINALETAKHLWEQTHPSSVSS